MLYSQPPHKVTQTKKKWAKRRRVKIANRKEAFCDTQHTISVRTSDWASTRELAKRLENRLRKIFTIHTGRTRNSLDEAAKALENSRHRKLSRNFHETRQSGTHTATTRFAQYIYYNIHTREELCFMRPRFVYSLFTRKITNSESIIFFWFLFPFFSFPIFSSGFFFSFFRPVLRVHRGAILISRWGIV